MSQQMWTHSLQMFAAGPIAGGGLPQPLDRGHQPNADDCQNREEGDKDKRQVSRPIKQCRWWRAERLRRVRAQPTVNIEPSFSRHSGIKFDPSHT
jgi:hypothetical protein